MSWWLRQANIPTALQPAAFTYHLQLPWVLYLGGPLVLLLAVLLYRWQRRRLPTASRSLLVTLTVCRALLLFVFVVVLAGPVVRLATTTTTKPLVALVLDGSQSMNFPAGNAATPTRRDVVQTALAQQANTLKALEQRFDVRTYVAGKTPTRWTGDALPADAPMSPLGDAVWHVLQERGGRPVAGIVLASDGTVTQGRSLTEAGDACRAARVPVFVAPVGSSRKAKDVALVDVSTSGQVALGDVARVGVVLESHGYDGQTVAVRVRDGNTVLDTKEITLRSAEQQHVELSFTAKQGGPRYLVVSVGVQDGETHTTNNADVTLLRVTEDKLKVLYLEGPPRWDYRFLKNAMQRDTGLMGRTNTTPDVVLEYEWRRLPDAEQAKALPTDIDELAAYHTIILGDVSAKLLTPTFAKLLAQAVRERGVGLVVEAGPQALPHTLDAELRALLPVQVEANAGLYAPVGKTYPLAVTPDGLRHEALQLYDTPERNRTAWAQMQPYEWCAATVRPTPGATVLAVNSQEKNNFGPRPLIAWHTVGKGRVFFVGTDSTWLWRQNAADRFFYKFWGQTLRFVARTEEAAKKKNWLEVQPVRGATGTEARVELRAYTENGVPLTTPTTRVEVTGPTGRQPLTLHTDTNRPGHYAGSLAVTTAGVYRFDGSETTWPVLSGTDEQRFPHADHAALRQLAETTGGTVVTLADDAWLTNIIDRLQGEAPKPTTAAQEVPVWDNWLLVALIVLVYSIDIGLRRWRGFA